MKLINSECGPRIAFCGPISGLATGQSLALKASINSVPINLRAIVDTGGSGIKWYRTMAIVFTSFLAILKLIRHQNIDAFYITPSRSFLGAVRDIPILLLARISGKRIIAHWHGAEFLYFNLKPYKPTAILLKLMWSNQVEHIALCETMRRDLKKFGFHKIFTVPNFYDVSTPDLQNSPQSMLKFKLLYLSNLIPEKGIDSALQVHHWLKQKFNVELHVIGARLGKLSPRTEVALKSPGVVYHGPLYGEDKDRVLYACDIFIFPSIYRTEAFPMVVLEAMRAGLAIVAYDHNYIKDFFNKGGGFLVPPSYKKLLRASEILLSNPIMIEKFKRSNVDFVKSFSKEAYQSRIRSILQLK